MQQSSWDKWKIFYNKITSIKISLIPIPSPVSGIRNSLLLARWEKIAIASTP